MAQHFHFSSLLSGPTTHIEHDETGDGSFKYLTGSLPLHMLIYFSSAIRDEYFGFNTTDSSCWCPPWASRKLRECSRLNPPGSAWHTPNIPTRIRLIGGDPISHLDLIHWMTSCCTQDEILPLSSIVASPTRHILALTSVHILGIKQLDAELPGLLNRLKNEMLDIDTAGRIFASGDNALPEIREAICTCVAGYFFAGRLQDVGRWMQLGKMDSRFDRGIFRVLEDTGHRHKLEVWQRKDASQYPSSSRSHVEHIEPLGRDFPSHHQVPAPPPYLQQRYVPPPPAAPQVGPPHRQAGQATYSAPQYYHPTRPHPANTPHLPWRTPSLTSSSASRSPSPRHRRVHFADDYRVPRAPAPPRPHLATPSPVDFTQSDAPQLPYLQPLYSGYAHQAYQQFDAPYGSLVYY